MFGGQIRRMASQGYFEAGLVCVYLLTKSKQSVGVNLSTLSTLQGPKKESS